MTTTVTVTDTETVTEAVTSTTCNLETRNGFTSHGYYNAESIRDGRLYLSAAGITGSATLMHTNTINDEFEDPWPGSILRTEEYIYFYNHKTDSNPFLGEICEYRISDGNKTYIQYASSSTLIARDIYMALIEGRKLLVHDWMYNNALTFYVHLVDFDASTCTDVITVPFQTGDVQRSIKSVASIKDDNNDIHLFAIIEYEDDVSLDYGIELRYKDYTHGGAWTTITKFIADEGDYTISAIDDSCMYPFTIVNNRYLVIPNTTTYLDDELIENYFLTFFVFDTETLTLDYKTWFAGDDTDSLYPCIDYMQVDNTNNRVYFENQGYTPGIYTYCEFDPVAMTFAKLYDSLDDDGIKILSTQEHAYAHDSHNSNNYQASTIGMEGMCTLPVEVENTCALMDDLSALIWYWDNVNDHIQAITMGNTIMVNIDPSISPGDDYTGVLNMGDCLIITTTNYGTTPGYCKYYIVV